MNIVVVFTGSLQVGKEATLLKFVNDYIVPAAISNNAISPNLQAESNLEYLIQTASISIQPVPALPGTVLLITGKTYKLDPNSLGWQDLTLFFQEVSDEAIIRMSGSPDMKIGLDNLDRLTESSLSRPVGLKGFWESPATFSLSYINQGDLIERVGRFKI